MRGGSMDIDVAERHEIGHDEPVRAGLKDERRLNQRD